jgi:hypothetical protein
MLACQSKEADRIAAAKGKSNSTVRWLFELTKRHNAVLRDRQNKRHSKLTGRTNCSINAHIVVR